MRTAAAQPLLCVAAVAMPEVVLLAAFRGDAGLARLLAGTIAAGALGAVVARRRSLPLVVASGVVGFFVVGVVLLYAGPPTPAAALTLLDDLRHGWGRLLSVDLPTDATADVLAFPLFTVWTGAFAAVVGAAWSRSPLAPTVAPVLVLVVALLVTASRQEPHPWAALVLVVVLAVLVALRARTSGGPVGGAGRGLLLPAAAVVLLAAVAVVAGVAATAVSAHQRFDPRTIAPPSVAVDELVTPLAIKDQLVTPARALFSLRLEAPAGYVDRVRVAALDQYDGATWTTGGRFVVAGRALPADAEDPGARVTMSVRVLAWPGPFLPALGEPVALHSSDIAGARAGFDAGSGGLVWTSDRRAGLTYSLDGVVPAPTPAPSLAWPGPAPTAPDARLPADTPAELRAAADRITAGATSPADALRRIAAFLRAQPYDEGVAPGHSYRTLVAMTSTDPLAEHGGYAEQHAAAFAVLARARGFRARVCVGYLLPRPVDGVYQVTTRDVHAWPEVHVDGRGWVAFEPTDRSRRASGAAQSGTAARIDPPQPVPGPPPPPPSVRADDAPERSRIAAVAAATAHLALLSVAALGALLLAAGSGCVLAKAVRRRRRATGAAGVRTLGAWAEATDRLLERRGQRGHGPPFTVRPADTPLDAARRARARYGDVADAYGVIAERVIAIQFAGEVPPDDVADECWRAVRQLRRDLDASDGRLGRLRAALDPRPLWRGVGTARRSRQALRRLGLVPV